MNLTDILFIIFAVVVFFLIIWEFIPECAKKYWGYQHQVRKDEKAGRKGKYSFTWRGR